jgi:anti-sigma regulatory factor (Ser/Thr protein kinase)
VTWGDVVDDAEGVARPDFAHAALFYSGPGEYLAGVGGFVWDGLARGAPVLVAVPPDKLSLLRRHLGADAGRVCLVDIAEAGRNPGRILTALTDFADQHGNRRVWLVGEPIWPARTPAEIREATRHEALVNLAFAGLPATALCPYDRAGLPARALTDAERTHPTIRGRGPSAGFTDPLVLNAECDAPAEDGPAHAVRFAFGPAELRRVRTRAEEFGRAAGLSDEAVIDLTLAVGEAADNAVQHGGGGGRLTMWCAGTGVVVEIIDAGRLTDPLAGRRRPSLNAPGGRGLWMIHQLCDLVELGPGVLRLHLG